MNPVKLYTTLANTQLAAKKRVLTAVSAVGLPPWPRSAGRQHLMDLFQDGIPVTQFLKLRSSRRERQGGSRRFFPNEPGAAVLWLTFQREKLSCFENGIPVSSGMPRNVQEFASFLGPPG